MKTIQIDDLTYQMLIEIEKKTRGNHKISGIITLLATEKFNSLGILKKSI
jgi:predicted CopG family antitoxin